MTYFPCLLSASSPDLTTNAAGLWHLEVGHQKSTSSSTKIEPKYIWHRQASFTEFSEFWQLDIIYSSFAVANRGYPTGMFWNNVICVKVFIEDAAPENQDLERCKRPMYRIILHGREMKKSYGLESEVITTFESEIDRIRALRETFGIKVRDEDEVHIKGRAAAL
jgi:hypothetical protein